MSTYIDTMRYEGYTPHHRYKQDIYDHGGSRIYADDDRGRGLICETYQNVADANLHFDAPLLLAAYEQAQAEIAALRKERDEWERRANAELQAHEQTTWDHRRYLKAALSRGFAEGLGAAVKKIEEMSATASSVTWLMAVIVNLRALTRDEAAEEEPR